MFCQLKSTTGRFLPTTDRLTAVTALSTIIPNCTTMSSFHSPGNGSTTSKRHEHLHVVVIVLGDIGRSPRMQYHSLSLLSAGHTVSLVGYTGEDLIPALMAFVPEDNKKSVAIESEGEELLPPQNDLRMDEEAFASLDSIHIESQHGEDDDDFASAQLNVVRFNVPAPEFLHKLRVVYFLWRIASLAIWLGYALLFKIPYRGKIRQSNGTYSPNKTHQAPNCVLVQNPPALPLLIVARIYCWLIGVITCRKAPGLIIDWHNLGYSMLSDGPFRKVAKVYEQALAPMAHAHLTVTAAMKKFLEGNDFRLPPQKVRVLPDCPPYMFKPRRLSEQHTILRKLHPQFVKACPKSWPTFGQTENQTLMTEFQNGKYLPRRGRPALITSSTSWTPDEDFGILLKALLMLDAAILQEGISLHVMVVVTGKGPEKAQYEIQISKLTLHYVAVTTMWLEPGDYPTFLACADVGVSLHTSTSGLDLPMKVLDLFGCQVPVCAMDFDCLPELVQDNVNSRIFKTSEQLAAQLLELLRPLAANEHKRVPTHSFGKLNDFSEKLQNRQRWHTNWDQNALPILEEASTRARKQQ